MRMNWQTFACKKRRGFQQMSTHVHEFIQKFQSLERRLHEKF